MELQPHEIDRRECLGFSDAVTTYIAPLLEACGFECVQATPYEVKFQSPNVTMAIFHDRLSYQIDLGYARREDSSIPFDLATMLDEALGSDHKEQTFFQASNQDAVIWVIKEIAALLKKYGGKMLSGDVTMFQRTRDAARRRSHAYTMELVNGPVRKAAEIAWRSRDYSKVKQLYERILDDLTLVEKERLKYAQSHATNV